MRQSMCYNTISKYANTIKGDSVMTNGIFGDMFDLNNDGNLDVFEQGLEFMFLDELTKEENDDSDIDDF